MGKKSHGKAILLIGVIVGALAFSFLASFLIYGDFVSLWHNLFAALGFP